jgi:coproporphyrinogen III oxidase
MGEPHLDAPTLGSVKEFLLSLQEEICAALEKSDG